jgi:magnesium and cobalt transporter
MLPRSFNAARFASSLCHVSDPQPSRPSRGAHPGSQSGGAHSKTSRGRARPDIDKRSLFERIIEFVSPGPDSKAELIKTLADAEHRALIEPESRAMLEGVLRMADMSAGDVMVAAPHMDLLSIDADYDELLHVVIDTAHSRFPVYEGARDNVIGILMAKDLLKLQRAPELNLRTLLRPAVFVPESKRLNELLRDFRSNRNHLAIVIDEFGNTAGLITIEDVLEEIVGEIEDEFDDKEHEAGIYTLADGAQRVAGDVLISDVNEAFSIQLPVADFDTIGGLVAHELGRVPRRGEAVGVGGLRFTVMITRGGAVRWFRVERLPEATPSSDGGDVD